MPTLWVAREVGSKEFVEPLQALGVNAKLATLDSADFAFTGNGPDGDVEVGIERKALSDLVTSLRDGRLCGQAMEGSKGGQLPRLQAAYDEAWLLVEGHWVADTTGRLFARGRTRNTKLPGSFTEDSLTKQLLSIEMVGGLHVQHTNGRGQTTSWLASLFRWFTDTKWDRHTTLNVTHKRHQSKVPVSMFREVTLPLPGIGLAGSKALEATFGGSLSALLAAKLETLTDVTVATPVGPRRLGESTARELRHALDKLL